MVATSSCTISSTILSETGSSIPGRILHQNLKPAFRCLPSRRPDDFRTLLSFSFLSLSYCPKTRACHPERSAPQARDAKDLSEKQDDKRALFASKRGKREGKVVSASRWDSKSPYEIVRSAAPASPYPRRIPSTSQARSRSAPFAW